jgi:hypothetical protein
LTDCVGGLGFWESRGELEEKSLEMSPSAG